MTQSSLTDMYCPKCGDQLAEAQRSECPACGWALRRAGATANNARECGLEAAGLVIDLFGRYAQDRLVQSWSDIPRRSTAQVDEAIAATWECERTQAARDGRALFNGELGRLVRVEATASALRLELGTTCYRDFLGTNLRGDFLATSEHPDELANPLGTSVIVLTDDGFLAFGRRSEQVNYHARHLHAFGGMLEDADRITGGGYDVFGAAVRELGEEINVRPEMIGEIVIFGLVRDTSIMQPELLFEASVRLSREELEEQYRSATERDEHCRIELVPAERDAIVPFIEGAAPVTAVAKGASVLFGRSRWGDSWYERAYCQVFGQVA